MIVKSPPVDNDKDAFYFIIDHLKKQDCKAIIPLTEVVVDTELKSIEVC